MHNNPGSGSTADELPANLVTAISDRDTMLDPGGEAAYFSTGRAALDICQHILNGKVPNSIIDFGCGFGRGMRWFRSAWPQAKIYGVEIDRAALEFVQSTFSVEPILGNTDFTVELPKNIDLIFSGSLMTHLDDWQWQPFLTSCIGSLSSNGTFVFTTHGRLAALMARDRHPLFGTLIDTPALYERYKRDGFAFLPYAKDYPTFGLTLSSPEWIMRQLQSLPNVKIVAFHERAWGQDVVAIQRTDLDLVVS